MNPEIEPILIETELIKNECEEFKRTEDTLHRELDSSRFFHIMETEFEFDYKTISRFIQGGVYTINEQHNFNIALRQLKRLYNIDISDSILFMEDTIYLSNILKFIDDETEWILTDELAKKFKIEDDIHNLYEICY
jgi:hypothetical protein